jgi:hypothetical protein
MAPSLSPAKARDSPAVTWVLGVPPLSPIGRSPPSLTALDSAMTIPFGGHADFFSAPGLTAYSLVKP